MQWDNDRLQEVCSFWQETLHLQDWDILIRFTRADEMRGAEIQGECGWVYAVKEATIHILDPQDFDESLAFGFDIEKVIVHELLHLHFAGMMAHFDCKVCPVPGEQAVDRLAKVLVGLSRAAEDGRVYASA